MILTEEQKANISVLVSNEVEYHETYQEVYDHVLTCLETAESLPDLQKSYSEILEQDFGGHKGIEKLENRQLFLFWQDIKQSKREFFMSFFKWPGVVVPLAYFAFCYYGFKANHSAFGFGLLIGILIMILLPYGFIGTGNLIIRLKVKASKKSIKSIRFNSMDSGVWACYWGLTILSFLFHITHLDRLIKLDRSTVAILREGFESIIFLAVTLYTISVFKVYLTELKKRLAYPVTQS